MPSPFPYSPVIHEWSWIKARKTKKKYLIFFPIRSFSYISGNGTFYTKDFLKKKFFLYFGKWNFLAPKLKTLLYFFRKKLFLYFGKGNFLALRTFRAQKVKKNPTLKTFLIFQEMELSSPKLKKLLHFF